MDETLRGLIETYNASCDEVEAAIKAREELAADASDDDRAEARERYEKAVESASVAKLAKEEQESVARSREQYVKIDLPAAPGAPSLQIKVDEPDMYQKKSGTFLRDLYLSKMKNDYAATLRISKHNEFELDRYAEKLGYDREEYAVSTGTLGGIIPPVYMVDLYAKAQRFGRVIADQCNGQELPDFGMSVIVPRLTAGTAAGIQASESAAASTQDPTEADLTVPVRTVAGFSPVSRQTLERAAYSEQILFEDLVARYNAALDVQLINGSGTSGQHLGILNTAGITTATMATFTVATLVAALWGEASVIAQINSWAATLGTPADKLFMHPRRWGAIMGLLDSQNRPLFQVDSLPAINVLGEGDAAGYGMVGHIAGLPVYTDANIPTNLGGGTNEDRIIAVASPAELLWERPGDPVTLSFEQQAGSSLQVQLVCYGYSAFTAGRYPAVTGVISGAGLV
jgi:HK97 family phage major capsid protein